MRSAVFSLCLGSERHPSGGPVQVDCHENEVPAVAAAEMDRLYEHLYCSPRYFEAARAMQGASLYIARVSGNPVAILPYKRSGNQVTVVSEYMTLEEREIERFAGCMFDRHPSVKRVIFPKVRTHIETLSFPRHAMVCGEDMVVQLPKTVRDYETAIGKNTSRNIKRYSNALARAHPSFRYDFYLKDGIREPDLRDIVALSCMRMKSKNIIPRFDEAEIRWIVDFARTCGLVGVARIDGRICAGTIGFRIGDGYFMHVIAHHPQYNHFSLGILCYYRAICEGISRGGKRFHLLQGRYSYKYRLLAERQDMIHLDIYRDRGSMLSSLGHCLRKEVGGRNWLIKQWLLHDVERKEAASYRFLSKAVNALRRTKRSQGASDQHKDGQA